LLNITRTSTNERDLGAIHSDVPPEIESLFQRMYLDILMRKNEMIPMSVKILKTINTTLMSITSLLMLSSQLPSFPMRAHKTSSAKYTINVVQKPSYLLVEAVTCSRYHWRTSPPAWRISILTPYPPRRRLASVLPWTGACHRISYMLVLTGGQDWGNGTKYRNCIQPTSDRKLRPPVQPRLMSSHYSFHLALRNRSPELDTSKRDDSTTNPSHK
jgi:hypothetical protein